MRFTYIVFYESSNGKGNTELTLSRKERPTNIEAVRKIEDGISKEIKANVSLTGFKRIGVKWK